MTRKLLEDLNAYTTVTFGPRFNGLRGQITHLVVPFRHERGTFQHLLVLGPITTDGIPHPAAHHGRELPFEPLTTSSPCSPSRKPSSLDGNYGCACSPGAKVSSPTGDQLRICPLTHPNNRSPKDSLCSRKPRTAAFPQFTVLQSVPPPAGERPYPPEERTYASLAATLKPKTERHIENDPGKPSPSPPPFIKGTETSSECRGHPTDSR